MDDRTVGLVLRALRIRRGWRQRDLAARGGCSQSVVSRVEAGFLAEVTVDLTRRLFAALEARVELLPRWRGAELERLLDAGHAALVSAVTSRLGAAGWEVAVEVTYSEYGERGSIDVLGTRAAARAALVVEAKTEIVSAERIGRKLDEKARLAPKIVRDRYGWTPAIVGRVVALPERSTLRRTVVATPVLSRMFPADTRSLRRWLIDPVGTYAGLWFLSGIAPRHPRRVRSQAQGLSERPPRSSPTGRPGSGALRTTLEAPRMPAGDS
jgi:transcriptional regulator with XRE-family HTH domain